MYKRALMLTAATVALLSGPANADTPISTATTTALKTSTSGNITFDANGSLTIAPSSTASTIPAIEIDSSNTVSMIAGSGLNYNGTTSATGIQADQGNTGEMILKGVINLTGSGTGKNGILIGNPTNLVVGTFTGIPDPTNNTASADNTALILASGSVLNVTGSSSYGVHLTTGDSVAGDIIVNGTIFMQPTNLTSTSSGSVTAVEIDGNMTGNLLVGSTGILTSIGAGAQGIVVLGNITGSIQNLGLVDAAGQQTPATNGTNPVAGTALAISGNVTGGIYNGGPVVAGDGVTAATLESTGNVPTVVIEPGFNSSTTATNIIIGGYTDPGLHTPFSFINRGSISNAPLNADTTSTAMLVSGTSSSSTVTLTDGILNTGTISATSTVNATASQTVAVTGISIGQFANVGSITNQLASGAATGGTISAIVTGVQSGVASGIVIATNATVPIINNFGTIVASATTSDPTNTAETAFGIIDQSGTLQTINNTGSITARAAAVVNGTYAPLDNNANLAQSINLAAAKTGVIINNTGNGTITGDIVLGAYNDTITTSGTSGSAITSSITANINFGSGNNTLAIGANSQVVGDILQNKGGAIDITIAANGKLDATNNGLTSSNRPLPNGTAQNIVVSNLDLATGGELDLTLSNAYNFNNTIKGPPIIQATPTGVINIAAQSTLAVNFGGFVSVSNAGGSAAKFIVFDASDGNLKIANASEVQTALTNGIPFLFTGSVCAYGLPGSGFTSCGANASNPLGVTHDDVVLNLTPKTVTDLGLTGYAKAMFAPANEALANDNTLGAAVIQAGVPTSTKALTTAQGNALYQQIYSAFAPDVTGSARAIAISLTDQATNIVGDRQRKLRMYASQDGEATLWAQEFGERLNVPNKTSAAGYSNTGFGLAMGLDGGDPSSGRYGGAFTFYAGSTREKQPRDSSTDSQWYMLTGYSDWRGRGLFFDSQVNIGYGNLNGKRRLSIDDINGNTLITRVAQSKRASEMAAGGFTTGVIMNSGGTVFIPQFSLDGLTLREEGYTENGGGAGMDLHVQPYYANSVRAFFGADLRQDLKMGSYFLQPDLRAGYRYDFLNGATKLKVNFAGDQTTSPVVSAGSPFSITGPDPSKGNVVVGGGLAVTTDAWSIGLNYDYARGIGGTGGTSQDAMLTLIGRI